MQQHVLLFRSKVEDKSPWNPNSVDRKKQYKIHFTGQSNQVSKCQFYNLDSDYMPTNRPSVSKFIQYFACKDDDT